MARQELTNKQRYLDGFQSKQSNEYQQLLAKLQEIQSQVQMLQGQYEQVEQTLTSFRSIQSYVPSEKGMFTSKTSLLAG
jgi:prefoldin subunit 5